MGHVDAPRALPELDRPTPGGGDGGRRPHRMGTAVALVCAAALVAAGALAAFLLGGRATGGATATVVVTRSVPAPSVDLAAGAIYAAAAPAVVDITAQVTTAVDTPYGAQLQTSTRTGSGSVLDRTGAILTVEHVVSGSSSVTVRLNDGQMRRARVLGTDPAIDIAVLRIDASGLELTPVTLGSVTAMRVGDPVYAIGDPFGYARSLSTGVVSGLDRTIKAPNGFSVAHAIQTDAALNPGNSGGPLLDARGRVIGVVDQIATGGTGAGTSTGVGFAVPIDVVAADVPALERGATPAHAYLGVALADTTSGALVQAVTAGTPAAAGGLRVGDVVVGAGGRSVGGVGDLVVAVAEHRPGDRLVLTVQRGTHELEIPVTLAEQPSQAARG